MIYLQITSEMVHEETSNTVQKIILNFLQIVSLAGGLPLQWPASISVMFESFGFLSSAGTTLLIPDCELSHIRPAEAFYYKQIFFTFLVPIIIVVCLISWSLLRCCCKKRLKLRNGRTKDYIILSIVLLLFLCYPLLTKITLSMLKCPWIGSGRWLLADLQEPCFKNDHLFYMMLLTIPQILIYIIGLPVAATLLIVINKKHLHKKKFYMRYGLLYLGYKDNRAWWELIIAIRKVSVVAIGTFGTLLRVVDVQAHLALLIIFISIVLHLIGKPFDMEQDNTRMLYNFELFALVISWSTFWGGLLFFLGKEKPGSISIGVKEFVTVTLVVANISFLAVSIFIFVREYLKEKRAAKKRKLKRILSQQEGIAKLKRIASQQHDDGSGTLGSTVLNMQKLLKNTQIVPVDGENGSGASGGSGGSGEGGEGDEGGDKNSRRSNAKASKDIVLLKQIRDLQMKISQCKDPIEIKTLKEQMKKIREKMNQMNETNNDIHSSSTSSTGAYKSTEPPSTKLVEKEDDPKDDETNTDETDIDANIVRFQKHRQRSMRHSATIVAAAHAVHEEFEAHELALQARQAKKQKKQRRHTQNRVMARLKIRKTKALSKVPMFKNATHDVIEMILEYTEYKRLAKGSVVCTQGDPANDFYIIVTGECEAIVHKGENNVTKRVGMLKELDFFGESALLFNEDGKERTRNATVIANSEIVQLLLLSLANFKLLIDSGVLSADVMSEVKNTSARRREASRKSFKVPDLELPSLSIQTPSTLSRTITEVEL